MEESLCDATMTGNLALLNDVIARDVSILDRVLVGSFKGKNPLHVAISIGKTEFVLQLMEIKPDLAEVLDTEFRAALHVASSKGHIEIVKALMKISPEMCIARDRDGNNPLHIAAIKGHVEVLKELVRTNPHRAQVKVDQGDTILHLCVKNYRFQCLVLLLDMIPNPDFVNDANSGGNTILHLAVFGKQLEMIKHVLSSSKIDVNAMNKSGRTALDIHFLAGNPTDSEIGYILRNAGAKLGKETFVEANVPSWVSTRRDTFMVVASLIATMAFQVGVSPPGGVWPDNTEGHVAGKALLAFTNPDVYYNIMVANTFVFLSSVSTILLLIFTLPKPRRFCRWIRAAITSWTFVLLIYTYILSVNFIGAAYKRIRIKWRPWERIFKVGGGRPGILPN